MSAHRVRFTSSRSWRARRLARPAILLAATFLAVVAAFPARAQEFPRWEIAAGLSYANMNLGSQTSLFLPRGRSYYGGDFAAKGNLNRSVGLVFDFALQFGGTNVPAPIYPASLTTAQLLVGPQFTFRRPKINLFAHTLVGLTNADVSEFAEIARRTNFALGLGGGLDINWKRRIAIRLLQADYVPSLIEEHWQSNLRASTGVVIRWGYRQRREGRP